MSKNATSGCLETQKVFLLLLHENNQLHLVELKNKNHVFSLVRVFSVFLGIKLRKTVKLKTPNKFFHLPVFQATKHLQQKLKENTHNSQTNKLSGLSELKSIPHKSKILPQTFLSLYPNFLAREINLIRIYIN